MEYKLDAIDKRIILELDRDARSSYASIASRTKIGEETLRYRIKRLLAEGILLRLSAVIDSSKLGFTYHKVLLKLQGASDKRIQKIVEDLGRFECVRWIASFDGAYDLGVALRVSHMLELSNFIDRLSAVCNELIVQRGISLNVEAEYLPRDYLLSGRKRTQSGKRYALGSVPRRIDETDEFILSCLLADARVTAAEIARQLKVSKDAAELTPEAIMHRVRRLEKEKIIVGYSAIPNSFALGQIYYKILLQLNQRSANSLERLIQFFRSHPRVVYLAKSLGVWDYEVDIEVESIREYREIMAATNEIDPHLVRDYSPLTLVQIFRYNQPRAKR